MVEEKVNVYFPDGEILTVDCAILKTPYFECIPQRLVQLQRAIIVEVSYRMQEEARRNEGPALQFTLLGLDERSGIYRQRSYEKYPKFLLAKSQERQILDGFGAKEPKDALENVVLVYFTNSARFDIGISKDVACAPAFYKPWSS